MSENSSDSDSSCGWTVIHHEGSDTEAVPPGPVAGDSRETSTQGQSPGQEDVGVLLADGQENTQNCTVSAEAVDETRLALETTVLQAEEERSPEDNVYFGAVSDDSDIVTLEPPKVEAVGPHEEAEVVPEAQSPGDVHMGSSSSSQYAFSQLGTAFPSQPSNDDSSSDDTSHQPSPAFRRRRARKKTVSSSESEDRLSAGPEADPARDRSQRRPFSSSLNKCVVLALVIAVSMGFGHFYGTIQVQKRQQLVSKLRDEELGDVKGYRAQCRQERDSITDSKSLKKNLARCWTLTEAEKVPFETQKKDLATENQSLRASLEKEEAALCSLQEELRKLREQIRLLEGKGTGTDFATENQKLRQHLEEEKKKTQGFLHQRETLLAEAKMLKRELDRERLLTMALRAEVQQLSAGQSPGGPASPGGLSEKEEMEALRGRLSELEQKLTFEQQRSDLWERLYVEAKDQNGKQEMDGRKKSGRESHKAKSKSKESFLGSVKETFDAMKNSTKEFVRHHKEKIKQAKEAVKENLKKFSDSVKSTFRHFKDTTKNIFDEKGNKRFGAAKAAAAKKSRTVHREYSHWQYKATPPAQHSHGPTTQRMGRKGKPVSTGKSTGSRRCRAEQDCGPGPRSPRKGCSDVSDCARQESLSLFNVVLDPVRMDEFRQLIERYLLKELDGFHHWKELDQFLSQFFLNGVFIHDQKLFVDFVSDVKDYLRALGEYRVGDDGAFDSLDGYIYRHFLGDTFSPPYGPRSVYIAPCYRNSF